MKFSYLILLLLPSLCFAGFSSYGSKNERFLDYKIDGSKVVLPNQALVKFKIKIEDKTFVAAKNKAQIIHLALESSLKGIATIKSYGNSKINAGKKFSFLSDDDKKVKITFNSAALITLNKDSKYWDRVEAVAKAYDVIFDLKKRNAKTDAVEVSISSPEYFISNVESHRTSLTAKLFKNAQTTYESFKKYKAFKIRKKRFDCDGSIKQSQVNIMQSELTLGCNISFGIIEPKK